MKTKSKKLPLRSNVCMLLFNKKRKLFLGERHGNPGVWQFPQGGAEPEFSLRENVLRELEEELGIKKKKLRIVKKLKATHKYDFAKIPKYARGKWRGQSQTFWLVEFLGSKKNINLDAEDPEFMDYRWCEIDEVLELAEPKRIKGYKPALEEFRAYLKNKKS